MFKQIINNTSIFKCLNVEQIYDILQEFVHFYEIKLDKIILGNSHSQEFWDHLFLLRVLRKKYGLTKLGLYLL